jgi:alpha-tubulin suppressor-like RCC1 family protein
MEIMNNTEENTMELAINSDFKYVYSWGFGKYGQIGEKLLNCPKPINIRLGDQDTEDVFMTSGGEGHSAIMTLTSNLYMFGKNYFGQLGLGHINYVNIPTLVSLPDKVTKISLGADHTLALTEDNNLYSWGLNVFGQLGHSDFLNKYSPKKCEIGNFFLDPQEEIISEVAAGAHHSLILSNKQRLYSCGFGRNHSLGLVDSIKDENCFKHINALDLKKQQITKITCGVYHSGCIIDNEILVIWGKGEILDFVSPTPISIKRKANHSSPSKRPLNSRLNDLKIGEDIIYVMTDKGEIFSMGDNKSGQMGDPRRKPGKIFDQIESLPRVKQIEVGYSFAIAISADNKVYAWGNNDYGQLAKNGNKVISEPTIIEELTDLKVVKIGCGGYHCLGIFSQNSLIREEKEDDLRAENEHLKDNDYLIYKRKLEEMEKSIKEDIFYKMENKENKENEKNDEKTEKSKLIEKFSIQAQISIDIT